MYNLLDYIGSIVNKQPIELDSGYSQYSLNMYFSKYRNCIKLLDLISIYNLTNEEHYNYLMKVIPYGWQKKLTYKEQKNKSQDDIDNIKKYYNVNDKIAQEYLSVISESELKYLREL